MMMMMMMRSITTAMPGVFIVLEGLLYEGLHEWGVPNGLLCVDQMKWTEAPTEAHDSPLSCSWCE
jgi:hypothetical protein